MNPNQLIPQLEGLIGSGLRGGANASGSQSATVWLEGIKTIMRSYGLRDGTDWVLGSTADCVEAGTSIDANGGVVYGVFIDSIYDTAANEALCVAVSDVDLTLTATTVDLGSDTVGLGDADSDYGVILKVPGNGVAAAATPVLWGALFPAGMAFATGIFVAADGEESGAVVTNDVRVYLVYRETVEVLVV